MSVVEIARRTENRKSNAVPGFSAKERGPKPQDYRGCLRRDQLRAPGRIGVFGFCLGNVCSLSGYKEFATQYTLLQPLLLLLMLLSSFARDAHAIVCIYMGERHNHGDRWVVRSAFIIECHVYPDGSWRAEVVACQTPKGIEMNDGDEVVEDDMKLQCRKLPYGVYQMQKHDIIRNINCEGHSLGIHVVNCLTDTGIPLRLNISIMLNGTRYNCTGHSNGVVTLTREFPRNFQITSKGIQYITEEKPNLKIQFIALLMACKSKLVKRSWIEDTNFVKECNEKAAIIIKACTADDFTINLNSELTRNDKTYTCSGSSNGNVLFKIIPVTTSTSPISDSI
ncbi:hypothetical protein DINM_022969 [Dirofilaria immitis]|nr:hypothetical protein [Dirofilaria immitis]